MKTHLVTGANRGIGLEFARQLAGRGDRVFAACRMPGEADDLLTLMAEVGAERLSIVKLDVLNAKSIEALGEDVAGRLDGGKLDTLINNAGIYGPRGDDARLGGLDQSAGREVFTVNVLGPLLVTQALRPVLGDGSVVMNLSSGYGSVAEAAGDAPHFYCASKAALNMSTAIAAKELAEAGIVTLAVSPGWTATDMGGHEGQQSAAESVSKMLENCLDRASPEISGKFLDRSGKELPF